MLIQSDNARDIAGRLMEMPSSEGDVFFVGVGEQCWADGDQLVSELKRTGRRFFGGVFPGVIWGGRRYEKACVVTRLQGVMDPFFLRSVSSGSYEIPNLSGLKGIEQVQTVMLFVDGLSSNISGMLEGLRSAFGPSVRFVGGGAGSLSLRRFPVVFSAEGIFEDAAVVLPMACTCSLGVRHGWKSLDGPFVANKTSGNVIREINYKNALSFYREIVERDSKERLTADRFYELAMRYPLGIHVEGQEPIVRDPLLIDAQGHLVCCGDVEENTVISILKGNRMDLIEAAAEAADDCLSRADGASVTNAFVVDCISRARFLGDYFERELDVINSKLALAVGGPEPMGVLTLGEIASYDAAGPRLFNKTTVLAVLR
ncbi:MAG: FIST N-terminal domain-containing protein [Kiritimatiellae bacterium]|nr:FIST N-terminal domain-containing protein [Kiritimatiellia bacterium]MDD4736189.1 FIST N-terminal domain-containing protein [Kiritimatiellia bacterium]